MSVFIDKKGGETRTMEATKDLRDRVWTEDEFDRFFEREAQKEGNSEKFRAVAEAYAQVASLRDTAITRESAVNMVRANEALMKACREYSDSRKNARTFGGRQRLAVVDSLFMFQKDLNLDQARDLKTVRELEGKTWREAGQFQVKSIDLGKQKVQVVGDAVSRRMKVECQGTPGYFTEEFQIRSSQKHLEDAIREMGSQAPEVEAALNSHKGELEERLKSLPGNSFEGSEWHFGVAEWWQQLGEKEPAKGKLGKAVIGDDRALGKAAQAVKQYYASLKAEKGPVSGERRIRLMEQAIEHCAGDEDKKLKKLFQEQKTFLMSVPEPDPRMKESAKAHHMVKLTLIQARARSGGLFRSGKKEALALDKVIEDGSLIHRLARNAYEADSSSIAAAKGRFETDKGNELSARNIASTRVAELLGIGSIIARSEKMTVKAAGQVMQGCFMEQAKGIDLLSKDDGVRRMVSQTEIKPTAGLNRDMAAMEIFDFLCAQNDRHAGNMLYQLSEPDENGKRNVIGLQGIDNDLAFGDQEQPDFQYQGFRKGMESMTFIDRDLAQQVRKLDRASLEYAVGDLVSQGQIDAMMKRVEKFQRHMEENMVVIEPDKWELNEFAIDQPADNLGKRGKAYVEGLKSYDKSLRAVYASDGEHKNHHIKQAFDGWQKEKAREELVEGRVLEGVQDMFREKVTFEDLKRQEPARRRAVERKTGIQIGAGREKAQVKQTEALKR